MIYIVRRTNVGDRNFFYTSHFCSYRVIAQVEDNISHHTLCNLSCSVQVTMSGPIFGPTTLITFIRQFKKSLIIFEGSFILKFSIAYLAFLNFFGFDWALIPREEINTSLDLPKLSFDSQDVIFILSILPNFNEMFEVMYLWLSLIYLCFLTLRRPQFFMFTTENSPNVNVSSLVKFLP